MTAEELYAHHRIEKARYLEGYRNGYLDKMIGYRSDYAWNETSYYCMGYRDGWLNLKDKLNDT